MWKIETTGAIIFSLYVWVCFAKWNLSPSVQYTNIHTEQRCCLHCMFAQLWVLGDNSTKLVRCLTKSQGLYILTKAKKLLITFWLVHCVIHSSLKYIPSLFNYVCPQAGGMQSCWFWTESLVMISPCHLYLFPGYPRFLLTSSFCGNHTSFCACWAGCCPFISLLDPLQVHSR